MQWHLQALQLVSGSSPGVFGFRAQAWVQKVLSTSAYRWLWHPWLYYLDHHCLTLWASFPNLSERVPSCWPTDFRPISCISIKMYWWKCLGGSTLSTCYLGLKIRLMVYHIQVCFYARRLSSYVPGHQSLILQFFFKVSQSNLIEKWEKDMDSLQSRKDMLLLNI